MDTLKAQALIVHQQEAQQIAMRQDPAQTLAAQASLLTLGRLTDVRATLKGLTEHETALVAARSAAQAKALASGGVVLLAGSLVSLFACVSLGWLLTRAIANPVVGMTKVMGQLAAGDVTVSVPATAQKDEVGDMARAVLVFKDGAIENRRLEAETAEQRRLAELERQKHEVARAETAKAQALVVDRLAQGLDKLSGGDLTFRIQDTFSADYEKLRADFNGAVNTLQEAMKRVAASTSGINGGSDEIAQASQNLSMRTEQQAANLEETAAALDEITATVKKTAEGALQARAVVGAAESDAERSGEVVKRAVQAMSDIEKSSGQISQIIGVIDEIAFQTNLLALNAGVEAARAGDAGRGFAVVASEVRALAQRSASAAKEIKALISDSSRHVNTGVELVGETGQALVRIVRQVNEINTVVTEIAASAQEQSSGLAQVNTAVNQMDQVTQQNAAMVEEATAASHALSQEATELAGLVAQFKVGAAHAGARRPVSYSPKPALKTTGYGGAALKPVPEVDVDSWEEF